ncbi:MAG TPA: hypothetical protein VFW00_14810 [Rhodocyclaceae bacterium]|nr:hypothetical protein [Rhodocyclaceae bacterium]
MPTTSLTSIKKLKLDLTNFRTVPQPNESSAIHAMISISPGPFWALIESLIEDGYLPTENILVQKGSDARETLTVKEGNRRLAALKLIHGLIAPDEFGVPESIQKMIQGLPRGWKKENETVPCTIYEPSESKIVEKIRARTHGKDEKAGRDGWKAVARARHNRDENGATEAGLDLLEKYLINGKNVTAQQKQRWTGDYPITVLNEAIKRGAPRFLAKNAPELANLYPKIKYRDSLEKIIYDIGLGNIGFDVVRKTDFVTEYGVPPDATKANTVKGGNSAKSVSQSGGASASGAGSSSGSSKSVLSKKTAAVAIDDPRQVARVLKTFKPMGVNRAKVVTLRDEIVKLKLDKNPLAFCFLLRSMFEISAKLYCDDHKGAVGAPSMTKSGGGDKALADGLRDIVSHLTQGKPKSSPEVKAFHGAITQLAAHEGLLSVTSMNQLVHNPSFVVSASNIAILFGSVFPLLDAMNQ